MGEPWEMEVEAGVKRERDRRGPVRRGCQSSRETLCGQEQRRKTESAKSRLRCLLASPTCGRTEVSSSVLDLLSPARRPGRPAKPDSCSLHR